MGNMPATQETWLEQQVGDGDQFVSIEDGDCSLVRAIDTEAHPLSYVLENHVGEYIVCDKESDEATRLREQGCDETQPIDRRKRNRGVPGNRGGARPRKAKTLLIDGVLQDGEYYLLAITPKTITLQSVRHDA